MGTWGTGLSSNDTFEDIYTEFIELYNSGLGIADITSKILSANFDLQNDYEDKHSFWFALAKAQWECGALDNEIHNKVKSIIESRADINLWIELNGVSNDVRKREKVLADFLEKISIPSSKVKERKRIIVRKPVFEKGDCLIFKLNNGNYGGVFVLEAEKDTEHGMNMMAVTTLNQLTRPTINDFEHANILITKEEFHGKYRERPLITWCYVQMYKRANTKFEAIGQLAVTKNYNSKEHFYMTSQWDSIPSKVDNLEEYEKMHGKANIIVQLKEWR